MTARVNPYSTPITRKFAGKVYHLAVLRVGKATAEKEADKLRRANPGKSVRLWRQSDGKYSVYSR